MYKFGSQYSLFDRCDCSETVWYGGIELTLRIPRVTGSFPEIQKN